MSNRIPRSANRRLTLLTTARALTSLGSGITPIALAFGLLDQPGGSALDLSVVFAAQALAALITMPCAGVVADRVGRSRLIVISELGMGIATAGMACLFLLSFINLSALTILAVVVGVFAALWWPSYASITPAVAGTTGLERANGSLAAATTGGLLLGNLLAGVLVAFGGIALALFIDAATFAIASLIVARACRGLSIAGSENALPGVLAQLRAGWAQFTRRQWLVRTSLLFGLVVMAWRASKEILGPAQIAHSPDGATEWSIIIATQSLGLFIGALVAARSRSRHLSMAFTTLAAVGVWILALGVQVPLVALLATGAIAGASIAYFEVTWYSTAQRHVPATALAHVSSMQAASVLTLGPIGLALAGPLSQHIGSSNAMLLTAAIAVAAAIAGWWTSRGSCTPR